MNMENALASCILVNRYIKAVVALRKCRQRREEGAL